MVSIMVKTNRAGVADFHIRINALEFRNLEERITRPILIPSNIQFHRNLIDRFIDVFKDQVSLNPIYKADRIGDKCFACMMVEPNIKIHKQCEDVDRDGRLLARDLCCTNCYCRPMWCVDCLARWFAARQNEHEREVWLEQKCTCPMCRAKFCVLDVSYIEKPTATLPLNNDNNDNNAAWSLLGLIFCSHLCMFLKCLCRKQSKSKVKAKYLLDCVHLHI